MNIDLLGLTIKKIFERSLFAELKINNYDTNKNLNYKINLLKKI